MSLTSYNPDVLSCLANLSNDEVFTPPKIANAVLDQLPENIWRDKNAKFLDPSCKTGVFLREIVRRLDTGLSKTISDRQTRINHILTKQVFGLAITELTALIARRSVYCSKVANGEYSVCTAFDSPNGNVRFVEGKHRWTGNRCADCGASQAEYDRGDELEAHAYAFIHSHNTARTFDMRFDVIIGNPPYQLSDGGFGRSASPIYQQFVLQAKKLNPRYLAMIIPSRWFAGGKGLDSFRAEMLGDKRIRRLVDFEDASEVFPGVDIAGGICYFLWDRDSPGLCDVISVHNGKEVASTRSLNEFETFIRHSDAVPIIRKVQARTTRAMNEQVSSRKPFGLPTTARPLKSGDITLRWQNGEGPYSRDAIEVGRDLVDKWKVVTSYVAYDHAGSPGADGRRRVFSRILVLPPGTICTETYLVIGSSSTKRAAENLVGYMKTKFFRFLVAQFMYSHHLTKDAYSLVPILDMKEAWTDERLAEAFGLTKAESAFIDSKIRPMDAVDE
jgi:site-specific DNA-methyltransferase (adenine-specific)